MIKKLSIYVIACSILLLQCYNNETIIPPRILGILIHGVPASEAPMLFTGDPLAITLNVDNPSQYGLSFSVEPQPPGSVFTETTGTLYWVPATDQTGGFSFTFTIAMTDRPDIIDSKRITITVWSPPKILDVKVNGASVTQTSTLFALDPLAITVSMDNPSQAGLSFSIEPLPAGGVFNNTTGVLSWVPDQSQAGGITLTLTVRVTSRPDLIETRIINLVISPPISLSLIPLEAQLQVGLSLQFTMTISGSPATAVAWSVNGIPGGNSTLGTVSTDGLYAAPAAHPDPSLVSITVTSLVDPRKTASARLTILTLPLTRPYLGTWDIVLSSQPISASIVPIETDGQISLRETAALTITGNMMSLPLTITNSTLAEIIGVNMTPMSLSNALASIFNPDNGTALGSWFWSLFDLPACGASETKIISIQNPGQTNLTVRVSLYSDNPELYSIESNCQNGKVTALGMNLGPDPGAGKKATVSHNIRVRERIIQEDHVEDWSDTKVTARLGGGVTQGYVAVTKSGQPTNRRQVSTTGTCRHRIYVTNFIGDSISVFDSQTMTQISGSPFTLGPPATRNCTLDGMMAPSVAAVDPEFNRIYAVAFYAGAVHALDLTSPTLQPIPGSPFTTGSESPYPAGMALDPIAHRLYVGNFSSNTIAVFDTSTMTNIPGSPFTAPGTPGDMVVDPVSHLLYVTHFFPSVQSGIPFEYKGGTTWCEVQQNTFSVWETTTMTQLSGSPITTLSGPVGLALDQDNGRLFVGHVGTVCTSDYGYTWNVGPPGIEIFSTTTLLKTGTMSAGANPVLMTYDLETKRLYVNNFGNTVLSGMSTDCIQAQYNGASSLWAYNTDTLLPIPGYPFATGIQPLGIGYDPNLSILAIANYGSNNLTVYNTNTMSQLAGSPFPTGGSGPVGVVTVEPGMFPMR